MAIARLGEPFHEEVTERTNRPKGRIQAKCYVGTNVTVQENPVNTERTNVNVSRARDDRLILLADFHVSCSYAGKAVDR